MPARAFDPLLSFLYYLAREIMYESYVNSENPQNRPIEPLPAVYPGTMVEPSKLRALIDDSFIYLSERRRGQIFQAFHDELVKPKNAAVRASMIEYFAEHALAVRTVMERLSKLNENEMRELSVRFAAEARGLPEEDREKLRTVLEEGLLPVPPDLNKRLVLAISDLPAPPGEAPAAGKAVALGAAAATEKATSARKDGTQREATPSPEATPSHEAKPSPEATPSREARRSPEAAPSREAGPRTQVEPLIKTAPPI